MIPDAALVINLARHDDRHAAFMRRWDAATRCAPVTVVEGVDDPDDPVLGCLHSHVLALRYAARLGWFERGADRPRPVRSVLILEDDAVFADDFTLDLPEPPPRWRLLRLGGIVREQRPAAGPWWPVQRIHMTHAYVAADPAGLAAHIDRDGRHHIGAVLAGGIAGHYRLTPATVGQAAGRSSISGRIRDNDQIWR